MVTYRVEFYNDRVLYIDVYPDGDMVLYRAGAMRMNNTTLRRSRDMDELLVFAAAEAKSRVYKVTKV